MRHAKAEGFAEEDQRRRLTDRGRRDARAAGEWLAAHDLVPTHVFVSAAVRARETWASVHEAVGGEPEVVVDGSLYSAGPTSVLDTLRTAPETAEVVLYLGHNPTAASLAHLLDDGEGDPAAFRSISEGFPTSAIAVYTVDDAWVGLDAASGRLVGFYGGPGS
jgi:phosphohistidine phosphatase